MQQITKRFMNWASILEDQTRAQVQRTSEMPFIYPHVALMPMPISARVAPSCRPSVRSCRKPSGWTSAAG